MRSRQASLAVWPFGRPTPAPPRLDKHGRSEPELPCQGRLSIFTHRGRAEVCSLGFVPETWFRRAGRQLFRSQWYRRSLWGKLTIEDAFARRTVWSAEKN